MTPRSDIDEDVAAWAEEDKRGVGGADAAGPAPTAATEQSPSSAGVCQACGAAVEKRYGGEGRYPVVCLDCWIGPAHSDLGCESTQGGLCERHAMEVHGAWPTREGDAARACGKTVYWWNGEYEGECELPEGHEGDHLDGLSWFTDDGENTDDAHT